MRLVSAVLLSGLWLSSFVHAAQPSANKGGSAEPSAVLSAPDQNIQDLRQDIQKMKNLVQQMEMNLAFVDTTQSPLKHQFQLEIDMWKTLIAEMESKLNPAKRP